MTASTDEQREELARRLPNVIRVAAGLAANINYAGEFGVAQKVLAETALDIVLACERVCGIGADDE